MTDNDRELLEKDGGPAFPHEDGQYGGENDSGSHGVSKREWFAGMALQGLCANPGGPFQSNTRCGWGLTNCDESHVAAECYALADAMLAQREKL